MNQAEQDLAHDVAGWIVARAGSDIASRLAVSLAHLHFYAATLPDYTPGAWTDVHDTLAAHLAKHGADSALDHRLLVRLRAVAPADPDAAFVSSAGRAADR